MDDAILSAQLTKNGNLMDICSTPEWLQEIEGDGEFDCAGKLGAAMDRNYVETVNKLTSEPIENAKRNAKLLSILFTELREWMKTWELGIGFNDVFIIARSIVIERVKALTDEQQTWVEALLTEDEKLERAGKKPVREKTKSFLSELFMPEDWQSMASKAAQAIQQTILDIGQVEITELETVVAA